ncbi:major facilitator superfamily domain-containing protein [Hyaloscypha finlandica]|nr:major facilitator superfamily domain-containing protein [Hyaloscypha finlandica]
MKGLASPKLLDTYETERKHIATQLINFDAEFAKAFTQRTNLDDTTLRSCKHSTFDTSIWVPSERGPAVILYSTAVTGGPTIGPIIGAAIIVNPSLGWRWTEYIEAIWVFKTVEVCFFCLPESYSPVLLVRRAKKLRAEGDVDCYHPHGQLKLDFKTIFTKHFTRPLLMLATEPTVTCVAFYASFAYGILYLILEVFPFCFQEIRGMHPVKASLPFLGLFIGVLSAVFINLAN